MEPEGAQGARSAPQATKGPALTLIVEEEPLAGWRLLVTSGPPRCLPHHGLRKADTESTQQTVPLKDNFNMLPGREVGSTNHYFWIKGTTPFKRKIVSRTALWFLKRVSDIFRISAVMWRTKCESVFVTCCSWH